jgi:hypothetical protein
MAANLMSEWRKVARVVLKQTSNVRLNPEDPGYGALRARVVWNTTRAYRREYLKFKSDVRDKTANVPENDPELPKP